MGRSRERSMTGWSPYREFYDEHPVRLAALRGRDPGRVSAWPERSCWRWLRGAGQERQRTGRPTHGEADRRPLSHLRIHIGERLPGLWSPGDCPARPASEAVGRQSRQGRSSKAEGIHLLASEEHTMEGLPGGTGPPAKSGRIMSSDLNSLVSIVVGSLSSSRNKRVPRWR